MKKIFTLIAAALMTVNVMASNNGETVSGKVDVSVGGMFSYANDNVTYSVTIYQDGDVEKMDVVVPEYSLSATIMGNLTLGSYTVKGLVYDEEKGGFYRDYKDDGISFHFKAVQGGVASMDNDYTFSSDKDNNILVKTDGAKVVSITNKFQMGSMPFGIVSTFTPAAGDISDGINAFKLVDADGKMYDLSGHCVDENYKGIVIMNGKKFVKK